MDLAVAQEAGMLEAGDQAQHAGLLAEFEVILKADEVVGIGAQIFLAQLHGRIRDSSGARIFQADRLHGAEAQRVAAAARDLFDGQAAFEVVQVLPIFLLDGLRGDERVIESVVFIAATWGS